MAHREIIIQCDKCSIINDVLIDDDSIIVGDYVNLPCPMKPCRGFQLIIGTRDLK